MTRKRPVSKTLFFTRNCLVINMLLLIAVFANAQPGKKIRWTDLSKNRGATFYDVQKSFKKEWKGRLREMAREKRRGEKEKEEAAGYEVYKRWESYMAPRVYPSGNLTLPSTNYGNFTAWKNAYDASANVPLSTIYNASNWTALGPVGSPSGPSPYSRTGAGRVNFVKFDPTNSKTIYIGTPDGGLWKSTDAGTTWATNTDFLSVIGCSDLAIDPTNTKNMYLATGDIEGDHVSVGVLKSTDGGATWNTTALSWQPSEGKEISKLVMNPSNPLIMIIATSDGIFRTTDGWATYKQTQCCEPLKDMKFKPGDPSTVYAAGDTFWKSTDNGVTWNQVTTGLPPANIQRIAIGVSAANPAYVYALIGKASDQSFLGMYRSSNSGTSFSVRSVSPNLMGYAPDGSDNGAGQAFYDLSIAVSPTNAEIVTTGGVNHWQSADGGTTWTNKSVWDAGQIHADVHGLEYLPGSGTTIYSCNDGGFFISTDNATNWTDLSHNLTIGQVVGIGLSADISTNIVDGEQDNGTNLKTASGWTNIFGGDGGVCFIDYTNNNNIYVQYVEGDFNRSDDGGATTVQITNGLPEGSFDFYSEWHEDPLNPNKLYVAGTPTLYGSINKGNNWSALGTPPGSGSITNFAIAPANTNIIYAVKQDAVSKSTDAGVTFTNITGALPADAAFSNVAVSSTDPNKVWVTYSGYSATEKIFKSTDGGVTWTNISTGLPNLPMNALVAVKGSAIDAVYLGADVGIYYFDNTLTSWAPFMTNLPHNAVRDLQIYYPTGKIRAATYGRSSWESNLYDPSPLPTISYSSPPTYYTGSPIAQLTPIVSGVTAPGYGGSPVNIGSGFNKAAGVAADAAGNLYVADTNNGAVKEIPAGSNTPVILASGLSSPYGLALDVAGNVYVAEAGNNTVIKMPAGGGTQVVLGSGFNAPEGVAVDAAGDVFVADQGNNAIKEIPLGGGATVTLGSGFSAPAGVAVDAAGNVYVADQGNNVIKEIPVGGGAPVTVASGFNKPSGITVDAMGDIFVADAYNNAIKEIQAGSSFPATPVAIGGAGFLTPTSVAVDGAGNVYIADNGNNLVKKVTPVGGYFISRALPGGLSFDGNTGIISGLPSAGSPATNYTVTAYNPNGKASAQLSITVIVTAPPAISYNGPQTYIAGTTITPLVPANSGGPVGALSYNNPLSTGSGFNSPQGLAIDAAGNIYITDAGNQVIKKIPAGGGSPVTIATGFNNPWGIAVDAAGNIYVTDAGDEVLKKIPAGGGAPVIIASGFTSPAGVAVDKSGNIYVADTSVIYEIPAGGGNITTFASGLNSPAGIAFDAAGDLFVADTNGQLVIEYIKGGSSQGVFIGAGFAAPTGIAFDASGNLYVTDAGSGVVYEIQPGGTQFSIASGFSNPNGLAADASGNVYVGDTGNNAIQKIGPANGYFTDTALPNGLNLDNSTGIIRGRPLVGSPATNYTITAYNFAGKVQAKLTIAVNLPPLPSVSYQGPQIYTKGVAITPLVPGGSDVQTNGYANIATISASGFSFPGGLTVDAAGNVYVADVNNSEVKKIPAGGGTPVIIGSGFSFPSDVKLDAAGNIYVADKSNNAVKKIPVGGGPPITIGDGFNFPTALAVDALGNVYVADQGNNAIKKIPAGGGPVESFVYKFLYPTGVAVDNAGNVYVTDSNNKLYEIRTEGNLVTLATGFGYAAAVAVDASGNIFVDDASNNLIKEFPAGGGAMLNIPVKFSFPFGIAIDGSGNLFVSNGDNTVMQVKPVGGYYLNTALPLGLSFSNATGAISGTPATLSPATNYHVTAYSFSGSKTATVNIKVVSGVADLADLKISSGTLSPAFATLTQQYTESVSNTVTSVKITPTTADANATVRIDGIAVASGATSPELHLVVGPNLIKTVVTAQNGTVKTYFITVTRALSSDANLANIAISKGTLTPAFAPLTTIYTATVPDNASYISIWPPTSDPFATVRVNGRQVTPGKSTGSIPLAVGPNFFTILVKAQDGTLKTYSLKVTKAKDNSAVINNQNLTLSATENPADSLQNDGVMVHQGVSPNGDGINDFLKIDGITDYPDNNLTIMDRNGVLLYEAKGYDNSSKIFDGHSNKTGKMQLPGTYFYSLEYKAGGITKRRTGFIVLKY